MNAYGVKGFQISGPGWLDSERYDIVAKLPRGATKAEFMAMLQNLLAERFKLTLHREKKDLPMYALVVGKNGPKLKESVDDPAPKEGDAPKGGDPVGDDPFAGKITRGKDGFPVLPAWLAARGATAMTMNGNARMMANGQSMARLAEMLSSQLDLPVVDMTGLTGKYDYTLSFAPEGLAGMRLPGGLPPPPRRRRTGSAGGERAGRPIQSQSLYRPSGAARAEVGTEKRPGGSVGHRPFGEGPRLRIDALWYAALAWLAVSGLAAAEHRGQVNFNGLPVPGATVTATEGDKKFVAVTDQQGAYSFPDLADGVWTVQVEMMCFTTLKQEVAVAPGAPSPVWELKVLPLEEIHASAMPPATVPQAVAPPAKPGKKGATAAANPQAGFQRADVNAAGEGAAQAGLGAETGNDAAAAGDLNQTASDAMVVSGSSSGAIERRAFGNARQGLGSMYQRDLSLILDNSALDARPFSLTGQNTEKPAYNHLRAGASFGGPLRIPHLLHGQGQFFVSYQTTRNRNDNTATSLMPDQAMRSGDFSQTVSDPSNGQPFPGNAIPASRMAPQSTALLKFYPLPNFPESAGYNYQVPLVGISHQDDAQGRLSKTFNRKHFVNGSFAYRSARSSGPNVFGFDDTGKTTGFNASATWRYMASQRVNFSLGYQFSRLAMRTTPLLREPRKRLGRSGNHWQ